jgi:hypothetical protein
MGQVHGPVPDPFFAVAAITLFTPNQSLSLVLAPLSLQDLTERLLLWAIRFYGRIAPILAPITIWLHSL